MALKLTVHEQCKKCGQREARKIGNRIIYLDHPCPHAPPGPRSGPRNFAASDVVFVPGEFDAESLRRELSEAWEIIEDLRTKRWTAADRAAKAVKDAMASVYQS